MTASLVVDALNMAAWTRHTDLNGLICHTDAGAQYTSVSYTDRIDELGENADERGQELLGALADWASEIAPD